MGQIFAPVFPLQPTHQADLDLSNISILAASGTNAPDMQAELEAEITALLTARPNAGIFDFQLICGSNGGVFSAYLFLIAVPATTTAWPALSTAQVRIFQGYSPIEGATGFAAYAAANPTRKLVAHALAAGGPSPNIMYGVVTGP